MEVKLESSVSSSSKRRLLKNGIAFSKNVASFSIMETNEMGGGDRC